MLPSTRQDLINQAFRVIARRMLDDDYCLKTKNHSNPAFPEHETVYSEAGLTLGCKGNMRGPWELAVGKNDMSRVMLILEDGQVRSSPPFTEDQVIKILIKAAENLGVENDIQALEPERDAANDDGIHGHVFTLPDLANG